MMPADRRPGSLKGGNARPEQEGRGTVAASEIDALRVDAAIRALSDHQGRPDGPAPAIDNSLLAAARIQASINRQRWRPPEPPPPAREKGLDWLASLAACVIAVALFAVLWEYGGQVDEGAPAHEAGATIGLTDEAGLALPAQTPRPGPIHDPTTGMPAAYVVPPRPASPAAAAPASPVAAPGPYPSVSQARRALHERDRPQARRLGDRGPIASARHR